MKEIKSLKRQDSISFIGLASGILKSYQSQCWNLTLW